MSPQIETELYLPNAPGSPTAIENMCAIATSRIEADAVAVAVVPANVSRAATLLFGTGIGVVSALAPGEPQELLSLARLSVAHGAGEIALPRVVLDDTAAVSRLKSFLGAATPITIDATSPAGDIDLAQAERALLLGADYVSFAPGPATVNPLAQTAQLVALADEIQRGGVKVASSSDHHLTVLQANAWAMSPGNSRRCLPVHSLDA